MRVSFCVLQPRAVLPVGPVVLHGDALLPWTQQSVLRHAAQPNVGSGADEHPARGSLRVVPRTELCYRHDDFLSNLRGAHEIILWAARVSV